MIPAMKAPRTRRRLRKPTEVRQAEIVEAAMHIIAREGSRKFTASLLASRVGVTTGAIFRHFSTMDEIVEAIVGRIEAMLFDDLPAEVPDPLERLGVFFERRMRTIAAHPEVSRLLLTDHLAQAAGRAPAARLAEFRRRSRDFVLGCLREAAQAGQLREGVAPEEGAVLVLGSLLSLAHSGDLARSAAGSGRLSQGVWSALDFALRGPGGRDGLPGRTPPARRRRTTRGTRT